MSHSLEVKNRAISLRRQGSSIKGVAAELGIAVGTASVWLRNVEVSESGMKIIAMREIAARQKGAEARRFRAKDAEEGAKKSAEQIIQKLDLYHIGLIKLMCACLYWAEGGKTDNHVSFSNSDPQMIKTFLTMLRRGFHLKESKFAAIVHVHEYHHEMEIRQFWSKVSKIPLTQFQRSYRKPNTGKRKKQGYKGTFRLHYYDVQVARELRALYTTLPRHL